MQSNQIPIKFPAIWANAAGPSYINSIPVTSQIGIKNGAASLADGFPPLTFIPVGSGGTPPYGQDFNGILKQLTAWLQWAQAGGAVPYDNSFATSIGGYPLGALIPALSTAGVYWLNGVENNTSNPDTGGANWTKLFFPQDVSIIHYGVDSGAANASVITATIPQIVALTAGQVVVFKAAATNTAAATLAINGLAATAITRINQTALTGGEIIANGMTMVIYDGTRFILINPVSAAPKSMASFTTAGTTNWTAPANVYQVKATITGGGGGGGGTSTTNVTSGCGGAGGTAIILTSVTPGTVYPIVVGAGGAGGANTGAAGATGGTSSAFGVSATGGTGGGGNTSGSIAGGQGGNGSGGTDNFLGGMGGDGNSSSNMSGACGGASYWGGGVRNGAAGGGGLNAAPGSGGGGIYNGQNVGNAGMAGKVLLEWG